MIVVISLSVRHFVISAVIPILVRVFRYYRGYCIISAVISLLVGRLRPTRNKVDEGEGMAE